MSTIFIFFIISLIILLVIGSLLYVDDAYTPYSEKTPTATDFYNEYDLPAPWFYIVKSGTILADNVIFNGPSSVSANFNDGTYIFSINGTKLINGTNPSGSALNASELNAYKLVGAAPTTPTCTPYTFISSNGLVPTQAKFTSLPTCTVLSEGENGQPGNCYASINREDCIDDDQVYGQENIHVCYGQFNFATPTGELCRDQYGQSQPINSIERFYSNCGPGIQGSGTQQTPIQGSSSRCPGSLSLLILGTGEPGIARLCINGPLYTQKNTVYDNLSPLDLTGCTLTSPYMGFPNQLFRVRTGIYSSGTISFSPSGPFLRIYSRGTGLCLGPQLTTINGIVNPLLPLTGNLQLLNCSTIFSGYWWYLLPSLTQPPPYEQDSDGNDIVNMIRPQLIYVTDPSVIPGNQASLQNWVFANINNIYSIQNKNFVLSLDKLIYVNKNAVDQTISKINSFTYVDYTLFPLLN
jgi:hypothetical protein